MLKAHTSTVLEICLEAKACEEAGDYAAARRVLTPLWECRGQLAGLELAEVYLRVGTISSRTGEHVGAGDVHETAKDLLTESLRLFEESGDYRQASEAGIGLALCCKQDGTFDEARVWLDHVARLIPGGEKLPECRMLLMRAIIEKDDGRLHAALELHQRIGALLPHIENQTLLGKCHGEYGIVLKRLGVGEGKGDYKDLALMEYTAASYHHGLAGNARSLAMIKNNISNLLLEMRRQQDALGHIEEAILVVERLNDRIQIATFEETRAQVLLALGKVERAEACARRSVVLLRIGGERALLVESLITHGRALTRLGSPQKARHAFADAIEVAEFIGFKAGELSARLATLEEATYLKLEVRLEHHSRCLELLAGSPDAGQLHRHTASLWATAQTAAEQLTAGRERAASPFSWEAFSLPDAVYQFEEFCIALAIGSAGGCQTRVAKLLKISDANLYEKLKHKYKHLKALMTKGRGREDERGLGRGTIALVEISDESLSNLGIMPGDLVVYRRPGVVLEGDAVVLEAQGLFYVGVYVKVEGGVVLEAACEGFESMEFLEGCYHVEGKIVGCIRCDSPGTVRPLELSGRQRAS